MGEMASFVRTRYGFFWRYKIRLLLIIGEPAEVESIAPGLTEQHWLEGDGIVLIHGGRALAEPDAELLASLRKLRRHRPLDGVVWPLTAKQSQQSAQMDKAWRGLTDSGKRLGFQAPLYLWQICDDGGYQTERTTQAVGCLLPEHCTAEHLASMLEAQTPQLTEQGMQQLLRDNRHDFLLRLAHSLQKEGVAHWQNTLKPLLSGGAYSLSLRGLMFSPKHVAGADTAPHAWLPSPVWAGTDDKVRGRKVGFPWAHAMMAMLGIMVMVWGTGLLTSFLTNRMLIQDTAAQTAH
jgi:type VI secretion system protein ImpL